MRQNGRNGERGGNHARTEVSAKKNKGSQFSKLNSTELSLRTEMDRVSEERLSGVD